MSLFITEYPSFFTATILQWRVLLKEDAYKEIVISSLKYLVDKKRINLYSFVIMDNHLHLIWQMLAGKNPSDIQRDFLKFTAQEFKRKLQVSDPKFLDFFLVNAIDRIYQFWRREPMSIELRNSKVFNQKLDYIHWNPVKAGMCALPEEYHYSSALFYHTGIDNWRFLTHANG